MKHELLGSVIAVVGLSDGDEGKGKITDYAAQQVDYVVRCQGGANAGHTLVGFGEEVDLHQIPAGICNEGVVNVIGNGFFLDPERLAAERAEVKKKTGLTVHQGNFVISHQAHVVYPAHKEVDRAREGKKNDAQGSTQVGIAFVASDKALREGIRAEDIQDATRLELMEMAMERREVLAKRYGLSRGRAAVQAAFKEAKIFANTAIDLQPFINDTVLLLHDRLEKGAKVLLEGAQAFGLDLDHGKYPFVTSSNPTVAGLLQGSGINHQYVKDAIGVTKLVPSKVGGGVFIGQLPEAVAAKIRGKREDIDGEFGKTSGRPRDLGDLDLVKLARAIMTNGITELALTKSDWLRRRGDTTQIIVGYKVTDTQGNVTTVDIAPSGNKALLRCDPVYRTFDTWDNIRSIKAKKYFKFIEEQLGVPVTLIGTGTGRNDLVFRHQGKQSAKRR